MGNTPKKKPARPDPADELALGVNVSSGAPGVTPVAFVAMVEVIDADGEKRYQVVESNGLTDARRDDLLSNLST